MALKKIKGGRYYIILHQLHNLLDEQVYYNIARGFKPLK
jgi:hypothetical protein